MVSRVPMAGWPLLVWAHNAHTSSKTWCGEPASAGMGSSCWLSHFLGVFDPTLTEAAPGCILSGKAARSSNHRFNNVTSLWVSAIVNRGNVIPVAESGRGPQLAHAIIAADHVPQLVEGSHGKRVEIHGLMFWGLVFFRVLILLKMN